MKVCHVTNVHEALDGRIFYKMACSAAKNGYDVTLVAPHNKAEIINGVKLIPISKPKGRLRRILATLRLRRTLLSIDADIYHFHDPELIPLMLSVHSNKHKIIYDIHEYNRAAILNKEWIPVVIRKTLSQLTWGFEKLACKRFECTISATEELSKIYERYSKNNHYLWNFDFKKGINMEEESLTKDIDIIHVGVLSKERINFLFDVIDELNKRGLYYSWCFIGVSKELYENRLEKYEKERRDYIRILDRIPFEEVRKYYFRTKIGINYHVLDEQLKVAMPLKIFEYMKNGLTVITSNLPPINRFVKDGVNGAIVNNNTVKDFADTIEHIFILNNFDQIGTCNKLAIYNEFNWEKEAEKLINIYEDLMK